MAVPISFPSTTERFSLPLLFAGQAQKEFFLNQAFSMIDALLQISISASIATPPSDPEEGECYRVTSTATGEWAGHEDEIAVQIGGAWQFAAPQRGMSVFDRQAGSTLFYDSIWEQPAEPTSPTGGATVDTEARQGLDDLIQALRIAGIFAKPA